MTLLTATAGGNRLPRDLARRRDHAELLHQTQPILQAIVAHELATANVGEINTTEPQLTRWPVA